MPRYLKRLLSIPLVYLFGVLGQAKALQPGDSLAASASRQTLPPHVWFGARSYLQQSLPGGRHEIIRSLLNVTKPMSYGSFVWNEDEIPKGPTWIRIDLAQQLLSIFRADHEIGTAVILYGSHGKHTPTGLFKIIQKDADHYSQSYDAPMPFMLRLTQDGIAIHGSDVRKGWATHGCVGVPVRFARMLFAATKKGDLVLILPAHREEDQASH